MKKKYEGINMNRMTANGWNVIVNGNTTISLMITSIYKFSKLLLVELCCNIPILKITLFDYHNSEVGFSSTMDLMLLLVDKFIPDLGNGPCHYIFQYQYRDIELIVK